MTLVSEHIESDTRERILVVAERLFRQIGYQKTTVADIAKELRMSPANVYRFFDRRRRSTKAWRAALMGEVEVAAQQIAPAPGPAAPRLRELMKTIQPHEHRSAMSAIPSCMRWSQIAMEERLGRVRRPYGSDQRRPSAR